MSQVEAKVRAFVQKHEMFSPGEQVLLALSGGADSVALLSLLLQMGLSVEAVHVHHGIRGKEADNDAEFCLALCQKFGVRCTVCYTDVPALAAQRKCGIEEAARDERYRILRAQAGERKICVAHNATDQFETVLFHLIRGTGTAGLAGMPPVRGQIVRPCLCVSKEELLCYVQENGLPFVHDSTNDDLTGTRNFLRAEVLPRLREIRPNADSAVQATCEKLRADLSFLEEAAQAVSPKASPRELQALPEAVFVRWLSAQLLRVGATLTEQSVHSVRVLLQGARGDACMVKGATVYHDGESLSFQRAESDKKILWESKQLEPEKEIFCGEWVVLVTADAKKADVFRNVYNFATTATICSATIDETLYVRPRQAGDRMQVGGMHRSAKYLLQTAKVPARLRETLPFFCDEKGLVWIPYTQARDGTNSDSQDLFLVCANTTEV